MQLEHKANNEFISFFHQFFSRIFPTNLFSVWGVEQTSYWFKKVFFSQFASWKKIMIYIYFLTKFIDSEFEIGEIIKSNFWANFRFRFAFQFFRIRYFARSKFLVSLSRSFLSKNYRIVILMPTVRILQIPKHTFFITVYCLGT